MKRRILIRIALALLIFFILFIASGWMLFSDNSPINRRSAIKTTQEWPRLAPFPSSARNITVESKGSAFSREFRITFTSNEEDIRTWLKESPGTTAAVSKSEADGTTLFRINPGSGAQFAEVILSKDRKTVGIRTYWN